MLFREVVLASRRVAETSSRLGKVDALSELLRAAAPGEVGLVVLYLSGDIPEGRIGVGWAALRDAAAASAPEATLTVKDVASTLQRIARAKGAGSTTERRRLLAELLGRATDAEQDFLRRLLLGELRQGAQTGLMTDAIARAAQVPIADVRRATMLSGNPAEIAERAMQSGAAGLAAYHVELFRPLSPMLAQATEDSRAALADFGQAALEYKLDGARIQVHREGDDVRVFSRGLHDVTDRAPELVEAARSLPSRRFVLDGEAIALGVERRPLPFQVTMRRFGRRLDVENMRRELPLEAFFFDCLHLEGEDLIDAPLSRRHDALASALPGSLIVPRIVTADPVEVDRFVAEALEQGHEGAMLKSLQAPYEAGRRGGSWLKIKPAHTLDLVVLAAEWGHGRRQGFLSNLHLGARDPRAGGFAMLGKTFKGMTDEMLRWQTEHLLTLETHREYHVVYVRPELVVEIAFDGVQKSSQYASELALRFARVKRYRLDKSAAQADEIETVRRYLLAA